MSATTALRLVSLILLIASIACSGEPTCGNSVREDGEVCDGSALKGVSCLRLGFHGGTLSCAPNCAAFDTTGCTRTPSCGDAEVDAPEVCDGDDLNGMECTSFGFTSGTLACASDCQTFDLSSCIGLSACGNNIIEAGEICDSDNLNGENCIDLDYVGGDLTCAPDCLSFDVSDCASEASCGNDRRELPEPCDGTDLAGTDCSTFGFLIGVLECQSDCSGFKVSGCTNSRPCVDSLDCPTTARRCDPELLICVECLGDDDCSCHQVCENRTCVAIGAPSLEHQWNAHGTWANAPGQPGYQVTGTCGADTECGSGEICNPFTAGCIPEQSASVTCAVGQCPGGTLCDPRTDRCFPAGLCFDDRNCCGLTDVACVIHNGSVGLCFPTSCKPPETPTSVCPFEPTLTDECPSGFCSPSGQCVECTCDGDCLSTATPRCDHIGGVCVADSFCRSLGDCSDGSACDRATQTCLPWCDTSNDCAGGESCDSVDHVCRCRPDDNEPNDAIDAPLLPALPIPSEGNELSMTGTLCADEDWFTMAVEAGNRIRVVGVTSSDLVANAEVIAPNGVTVIAWEELSASSIASFELLIDISGTHYLRLAPASGHGDYQLQVRHISPLDCDVGGPDDVVSSATALNSPPGPVANGCELLSGDLGGPHTVECTDSLEICIADIDYYRVHAPENSEMTVTIGGFTGPDLDLALFGPFDPIETPDATRLLMVANTDGPTEVVSTTTRGAATYLVLVDSLFAGPSEYNLMLEITAAPPNPGCTEDLYDDVTATPEPFDLSGWNDTMATASGIAVVPGTPTVATLNMCAGDRDWLTVGNDDAGALVGVPLGHRVEITVTPESGPADDLVVFAGVDPVALAAAVADPSAGSQTARMLSNDELIYVVVAAKPAATLPRAYDIEITEVPPPTCDLDDLGDLSATVRNDTPAEATVLASPPWPAVLGDPSYSFPAAPGDVLTSCSTDDDWLRIDGVTEVMTATIHYDSASGELGLAAYDSSVTSATTVPGVPPTEGLLELSAENDTGQQSLAASAGDGTIYLLVYNRSQWPVDYALTTEITAIINLVDAADVAIPRIDSRASTCGAAQALSRTIDVTSTGYVVDVDVQLDITHGSVSELDIFLEVDNDGTPVCVELSTANGGFGNNLTGTIFDDQAVLPITLGVAPFTGRFRPETPLAALHNAAAAGDWTLWVSDANSFTAGTLDSWSLVIERSATLMPPAAPEVVATGADALVTLTWEPVLSATSYDLYWAESSGVTSSTGTPEIGVTSGWTHTPVVNGTPYYYIVVAYSPAGQSPDSTEVSATPAPIAIYTATPGVKIPDNGAPAGATCGTTGGASSTIEVTETQLIGDVDVGLNIVHTYDGDLEILLEFDGSCIELARRVGQGGDGFVDTVFDDAAPTSITAGTAPFTGSFSPQGSLSSLNGSSMAGKWTLHVFDAAKQDDGILESWSLTIRY